MFKNIEFANPELLLLLLLLPLIGWWYRGKYKMHYAPITMSNLTMFTGNSSWRGRMRFLLPLLRGLTFMFLIVAMSRPQALLREDDIQADGIDIMLTLDLSSSMLAQDFEPDRLEVAKKVASDFAQKLLHGTLAELHASDGEARRQMAQTVSRLFLRQNPRLPIDDQR